MELSQDEMSKKSSFDWEEWDSDGLSAPAASTSSSNVARTLPAQIANRLADGIIRGAYKPGARLQEHALAKAFGVSRGPVREALRILESEGLVTIRAQRGASVTKLSCKDVESIFSVRSVMMGLVAVDIARRGDPEVLAGLEAATEALKRQLASNDVDRFLALVYHVSMFFAGKAENGLARDILFSVGRQTLSFTRKALTIPRNRSGWVMHWKRIAKTVRSGDAEAAERAARALVDMVGRSAIEEMETCRPGRRKHGNA